MPIIDLTTNREIKDYMLQGCAKYYNKLWHSNISALTSKQPYVPNTSQPQTINSSPADTFKATLSVQTGRSAAKNTTRNTKQQLQATILPHPPTPQHTHRQQNDFRERERGGGGGLFYELIMLKLPSCYAHRQIKTPKEKQSTAVSE